jgi:uncharacterized protein YdiU (UPF0061 family)
VGQLELFARRARKNEHPKAMEELEKIVLHSIDREYCDVIDPALGTDEKVVLLAYEFRDRLTSLIANWIRVGFCQGNFNSDNCAVGGYTLDYGPFGFLDVFNPQFQSWIGGGQHFSFMNQPVAAQRNFETFCSALRPLLASNETYMLQLEEIQNGFADIMQAKMEKMWATKLGLQTFDAVLFSQLETLMTRTPVDYTIFFRELSTLPEDISPLRKSFYRHSSEMDKQWSDWLTEWQSLMDTSIAASKQSRAEISKQMKLVNPKIILREWFVVPAYQQASLGEYSAVHELQDLMTKPYADVPKDVEEKYYRLKPLELFQLGGLSHYSCSS